MKKGGSQAGALLPAGAPRARAAVRGRVDPMNYPELKALARRADRARGEERERLVEKLIGELPKLENLKTNSSFLFPDRQQIYK